MYWNRSEFWNDLLTVDDESPRGKIDKAEARIGKKFVKNLASNGVRAEILNLDILRSQLYFSIKGEDFLPKVFGDAPLGDDDELLEMIESPEYGAEFDKRMKEVLSPYLDLFKDISGWDAMVKNGDLNVSMGLSNK
jgi:hypothetical protein